MPRVGDAVGLLVAAVLEVVGAAAGDGVPAEAAGVAVEFAPVRAEAGGWPGLVPLDADELGCVPPGEVPPDPELPELALPPPSGWLPCPGAEDEDGCGAAHCVNGACGPPDMATMRAPRQTVITAMVPNPANRKTWWRRPDGSANTGLESTQGL